MWADYYEKYRGTPKFGMSEQDKLEAQARMADLKNTLATTMLMQKMQQMKDIQAGKNTTAETIAAGKLGADVQDGKFVPSTAPAPVAQSMVDKNTSTANVNTARANQLDAATGVLKNVLGSQTSDASGTPNDSGMVVSGGNVGGVKVVNPKWQAQKEVMGEEAKNYGVQNTKTNASLHGVALLNAAYDPGTDTYNLSKLPAEELTNVATTVISSSQKGDAKTRDEMRIRSLQGDAAGALSWALGKPINAVSGDNARMLEDILFRQGSVSSGLKKQSAETMGTDPMGADFDTEAAKYPVYQAYQKRKSKSSVNTQGTQTSKSSPGDLKAKWGLI